MHRLDFSATICMFDMLAHDQTKFQEAISNSHVQNQIACYLIYYPDILGKLQIISYNLLNNYSIEMIYI